MLDFNCMFCFCVFFSQWFDLYFSEVRPVMLGKKRKRVEDDDETDERFFISSTGKAIYNASNDLERLHKK